MVEVPTVEAEEEVPTEVTAVAEIRTVETVVEVRTVEIEEEVRTVETVVEVLTEVVLEETSQVSQLVVTSVETTVPFHLNQMEANLSYAETVFVGPMVDHHQAVLIENLHLVDSMIDQKIDHDNAHQVQHLSVQV